MTETTAKPQREGDKRNIPEEIHQLASALSRELMRVAKPKKGRNSRNGKSARSDGAEST